MNKSDCGAGSSAKSTPQVIRASNTAPLMKRCAANTMAPLGITSASLAHAMTLPEKVTPPIITERKIVTAVNVATATAPASPPNSAAQPTRRLAMPPEPLKIATISGIAVMATRREANAPTRAPAAAAMAIQWNSTMPFESSVTTMAMNMPPADSALPERAVAGEPSIRKPKMNITAAAM